MNKKKLEHKLTSYYGSKNCEMVYEAHEAKGFSLQNLRDKLLDIGEILEEDLDQGIYVAQVRTGFAGFSSATLAAETDGKSVYALAFSEGPGGEKRANESIELLFDAISGEPHEQRKQHGWPKVILVVLLALAFTASVFWALLGNRVTAGIEATKSYNSQVVSFNEVVPTYNASAENLAVENIRGIIPEAVELSQQPDDLMSVMLQVIGGNDANTIRSDANTVRKMKIALEADMQILEAINNPDDDWILEKLNEVDEIADAQAVTSNDDPNDFMGKAGGYTSCVYFTTTLFDADEIPGANPVEKGTDGGGAIESYATLDDAKKRCEYLSEFDGTLLTSGSYALVGTMVVRTSCLLTEDAQYELTSKIVEAMVSPTK